MTGTIRQEWPDDLCPESCDFRRSINHINQISPVTRKARVIKRGRTLWKLSATWTLENGPQLVQLRRLLEKADGPAGSFMMWDFSMPYPSTEAQKVWPTGAGALTAASGVADTDFQFTGGLPNFKVINAGDYFQVGNRVYVADEDFNIDATGSGVLKAACPSGFNHPAGTIVKFYQAKAEFQLQTLDWGVSATARNPFRTVRAEFLETAVGF